MNKALGILLGLVVAASAQASEVTARGHSEFNSCGYYSSTTAQFNLNYRNAEVQWGERVFLVYALSGVDRLYEHGRLISKPVEWQSRTEQEMASISPYTWATSVGVTLSHRSGNRFFDRMPFVFRIEHVDGTSTFDNGGAGAWGFYEVMAPKAQSCQPGDMKAVDEELKVSVINR